jgi:hypothetical protein
MTRAAMESAAAVALNGPTCLLLLQRRAGRTAATRARMGLPLGARAAQRQAVQLMALLTPVLLQDHSR